MFVHDFCRIATPLDAAVATFGDVVRPRLSEIVADAYRPDRSTWIEAGARGPDVAPPGWLSVEVGVARVREDAVVIPLAWNPTGGRLVAAVEADLQMSACGPHLTDLDVLARYRLAQPVPQLSADATIARRLTTTALRRFLESLSRILDPDVPTVASGIGTALPA